MLKQAFEERKRKVLDKTIQSKSIKIYLRNFILIDSQSNMELFCNTKLVGNIYKAKKKMRLQSNGGKVLITNRIQVASYKPHVWFYQKDITTLITLKIIIKQYHFACNSWDEMFIVHREEHGNHNMHFIMHDSSLHYYDPEDEDFVFLTHSQSTSKVTERDISRLLNKQGNFMLILVTHKLKTTSGSYREIK